MSYFIRPVAVIAILVLSIVSTTLPVSAAARKTSGGTSTQPSGKKLPPPPSVPIATLHFCGNDPTLPQSCDPANNAFSISTVRDITVFVSWQNVTGPHIQKVLFLMPNGDPYQAMATAFDTTTGQGVQLLNGVPTVSNVLPISGTWIQQRALTGTWTVQVYLDDVLMGQGTLNLN